MKGLGIMGWGNEEEWMWVGRRDEGMRVGVEVPRMKE